MEEIDNVSFSVWVCRNASSNKNNQTERDSTPSHMPSLESSDLGRVEYDECLEEVSELADPNPSKKRKLRGAYTAYTPTDRAKIGKYAAENGNKNARVHFLKHFPNLNESTVRNFKKAYLERMKFQQKQLHPQPVTQISIQPRGRPPLMMELDSKLVKLLHAVRSRGGIINIHVVRASAKALIATNPQTHQQLSHFDMPRSWVSSIYRRMGLVRRMGTTSRPPVPQGLYDECKERYLNEIMNLVQKKQHSSSIDTEF